MEFFLLYTLVLIFSFSNRFAVVQGTSTVATASGVVIGKEVCHDSHCSHSFLGIPFAEPPVGALRFKRPVAKKPWGGLLRAVEFSKPCFQRRGKIPAVPWQADESESSEDCLYLNVWTPSNRSSDTLLPAMLWLHGGSFRIGSANLDVYDGSVLASYGQVVVVSTNYRLGAFGFMNANTSDVPGNAGLWDQYLALRWVHDNVGAFGSDRSRVTLFGESVGAASTGMLALSPLSRGLVRRIIMQSGTPRWPLHLENESGAADASRRALDLVRDVGCLSGDAFTPKAVACLQNVPPEDVASAELRIFSDHVFTFLPSIGDALVPVAPIEAVEEDVKLPIDVMMGTNVREGAILFFMGSTPDGVAKNWTSSSAGLDVAFGRAYIAHVFAGFPKSIVERISERYLGTLSKRSAPEDVFAALVSSDGDFMFNCPALFLADSFSSRVDVLLAYKFGHRALPAPWPEEFEATHSDEIQFVFGAPLRHPGRYSTEDVLMSETIMSTWASFAHTGTPQLPGRKAWPRYDKEHRSYVAFQHGSVTVNHGLEGQNCDFWKGLI
ncbi:acetylcholinesterase-1-like [Dermacentor albipictus]|uniref:acetylcholinesterase-1-like n=1 Tax=Dermacentor albipictus TaxID=60249 RepID=UPI0031FDC3F8